MDKSSVDCWNLTRRDVQKHQSFVVTCGSRSSRICWIWSIDHSHVYLAVVWSLALVRKLEDSFVVCYESSKSINKGRSYIGEWISLANASYWHRNALLNLVRGFVVSDHIISHECCLRGRGCHRRRRSAIPEEFWRQELLWVWWVNFRDVQRQGLS